MVLHLSQLFGSCAMLQLHTLLRQDIAAGNSAIIGPQHKLVSSNPLVSRAFRGEAKSSKLSPPKKKETNLLNKYI